MNNLLDRFTGEMRNFIVKEKNLVEVLKMVEEARSVGPHTVCSYVGNCAWTEEPDLWFINVSLTKNQWRKLLEECKNNNYKLMIKDIPDRMYFTKGDES